MSECQNLWQVLDVPNGIVLFLISVSVILVLMPIFAGRKFGLWHIPDVSRPRLWALAGWVIFAACIFGYPIKVFNCTQEFSITSPVENAEVGPVISVRVRATSLPVGKSIRVVVCSRADRMCKPHSQSAAENPDNIWTSKNVRVGEPEDWYANFDIVVGIIDDNTVLQTETLDLPRSMIEGARITVKRKAR